MRRGEIIERVDVNYAVLSLEFEARLSSPKFPLLPIREIASFVQYGTSDRATEEEVGLPVLRMSNLQKDGWDLSELKYMELTAIEAEHYRLEQGDILFNRTNSKELVGKCEVFREEGYWVFASYLIRLQVKPSQALPDFVSDFLSTQAGRVQINRVSRQIVGMSNINAQELRDLVIPLPPLETQRELVAQLDAARQVRQNLLNDADDLLASLDGFLLEALVLEAPENKGALTFAVKMSQLRLEGAVNPERYAGLFLEKAIQGTTIKQVAAIVESKVSPSREAPKELWDWIRIDDLPNKPLQVGEVRTLDGAEIDGSFFEVQENDILVARLGPTIQNAKFVLCPPLKRQTVASSEFLVLRCKDGWSPTVVLWVLRTSFFRRLIYSKGRGGTPSRYRVNKEDFAKLPFPNQPTNQKEITEEIEQRLIRVQESRAEAEAVWDAAKARFEAALLG